MKIKIVGTILCMTLLMSFISGCGNDIVQKDTKSTEIQIEENIVGSWNAGSAYMVFFENGEMGLFSAETGNGEIMTYEVNGDTVTLFASADTVALRSVEVNEATLTYISEQGNKNIWLSVSTDEVLDIMNEIQTKQ